MSARAPLAVPAESDQGRFELAWASLLYVALTFVLAYPLSVHPADRLPWMGADTELYLWTLMWNTHALTHNPLGFLDANICYPQRFALATTENLAGSTIFAAPVLWLTGNPVLALNLVVLVSAVLCGVGTFVLCRRLGLGRAASMLAGIVFAFSPPRFARIGQLHLATVQWVPFALAALHAYLDEGWRPYLWMATALFTLQAMTSGHGAVFLLLAMAALVAWRLAFGERLDLVRRVRDFGLVGVILILPSVLLILPYRAVQQDVGLRRQLDDTWWTDWLHPALSYVASPAHVPRVIASWFVSLDVIDRAKSYLFPGILPLVLAGIAVWRRRRARDEAPARSASGGWSRLVSCVLAAVLLLAGVGCLALAVYVGWVDRVSMAVAGVRVKVSAAWRPALLGAVILAAAAFVVRREAARWDAGSRSRWLSAWKRWRERHRRDAVSFYALLALGTLWLSAGAPVGPWPWLYSLPGFTFIRVPARFTVLSLLALAVLCGFGFERLTGRLSGRKRRVAAVLVGAALAAEFAIVPMPTAAYRLDIPAVDRWLDTQPKPFVVAEVPFSAERDHTTYMLHSTAHWQRTLNGYTGFRSPLHEALYPVVRRFPSPESVEALSKLGVNYVVVHGERYRQGQWPAVQEALARAEGHGIRLLHADGMGRVYALENSANGGER